MAKVSIAMADKAAQIVSPIGKGEIESRALFNRPSDPIHLLMHRLGSAASAKFLNDTADLALFVWKGSVVARDATLTEKSSVVIERGASLDLIAGSDGAVLLAFNISEGGAHAPSCPNVHILPSELVPRTDSLAGNDGVGGALHADARCPTCNVWLHENTYKMADKETAVHSHSEDEVIFFYAGTVRLGNRLYGPGTALAIAANTKYGFFTGPDGLSFVNFRGSPPTYTSGDGKLVMDEAKLWRELLGEPKYLGSAP